MSRNGFCRGPVHVDKVDKYVPPTGSQLVKWSIAGLGAVAAFAGLTYLVNKDRPDPIKQFGDCIEQTVESQPNWQQSPFGLLAATATNACADYLPEGITGTDAMQQADIIIEGMLAKQP